MENLTLHTPRLYLEKGGVKHLEMVHELLSKPETDRYNTLGIPENMEQTRTILNGWILEGDKSVRKSYTFSVFERHSLIFVGLIALTMGKAAFRNAEVWYKLHPIHWNKGYGTEALKRVLEFGFSNLGLHRIEAGCAIGNGASIRLLEKVGMQREGQKRKVLPLKTGWSDNYIYAILAEDQKAEVKKI
tara:strand:- start:22696 stop:23259 length:564 start_codon:yes stop_codon:yes gene_type:complete